MDCGFFLKIWERHVLLPGIIDSSGVKITNCHFVTIFLPRSRRWLVALCYLKREQRLTKIGHNCCLKHFCMCGSEKRNLKKRIGNHINRPCACCWDVVLLQLNLGLNILIVEE